MIHGGFAVGAVTLNRFFLLHLICALLLLLLATVHILALHDKGSTNHRYKIRGDAERVNFYYFFVYKDIQIILFIVFALLFISFIYPNYLNHPDNFNEANPMVTPPHIIPEWYFLPFYAILRSIPSKLGGVVVMFLSIVLLFAIPIINTPKFSKRRLINYKPTRRFFARLTFCFLMLTYLGAMPAEAPYVSLSKTIVYLYYYVFFRAIVSKMTLTMFDRLILIH